MHRAIARHQSWKPGRYVDGCARHLATRASSSDGCSRRDTLGRGVSGVNSFDSGSSRALYGMECAGSMALTPFFRHRGLGSRTAWLPSAAPGTTLELRRSLHALRKGGKAIDPTLCCGGGGGGQRAFRNLSSKRLLESALQVLRDLRSEKFRVLGRSTERNLPATPDKHQLSSSACENAVEEFEWSSALWEAEMSGLEELEASGSSGGLDPSESSAENFSTDDKQIGSHTVTALGPMESETSFRNHPKPNSGFPESSVPGAESIEQTTAAATIYAKRSKPEQNEALQPTHDGPTGIEVKEVEKLESPNDCVVEEVDITGLWLRDSAGASASCNDHGLTLEKASNYPQPEALDDAEVALGSTSTAAAAPNYDPAASGQGELVESEGRVDMERIRKLRSLVAYHAYQYNTLDSPLISDSAYDALVKELEKLELSTPGASFPTSGVGAPPALAMLKVQHRVPMLSLTSVQKEEELQLWNQRLQQRLGPDQESPQWVVEPKVDGLALSLRFENGKLICAATRGNGLKGEDVTHNAQHVRGIPVQISQLSGTENLSSVLEVRGEIFMPLEDFNELNAIKMKLGEKAFANPRNAAAGSMRLLSSQKLDHRPLSFVAYSIVNMEGHQENNFQNAFKAPRCQWDVLQVLHSLGFTVNKDNMLFNTFDDALNYAKSWRNKRESLEYEADGVVFKVNDLAAQVSLGAIGGNPRWAVAWKFPATEAVTVLEAIEMSVGRSGVIVPNARLKPVELGGVTISRATLHNFRNVKTLGLCEGDHVIVRRAGDVIPQVVEVLEELRPVGAQPWSQPQHCPSCGADLQIKPGKAMVFCQNLVCLSRQSRQVEHFAKLLIHGLGPKTLSLLQEEGLVMDPADLYSLEEESLAKLKGLGTRSARKLLGAIQESKKKPVWAFIVALGIPNVGEGVAHRLEQHFGDLQGLLNAKKEELLMVPGVGEMTLTAVYDWCRCDSNIHFIRKLHAAGCACSSGQFNTQDTHKTSELALSSESPEQLMMPKSSTEVEELVQERQTKHAEVSEGHQTRTHTETARPMLFGKTVVITGNFGSKDREDMQSLVKSYGAKVRTTVTSKTSFLLVGERPGPVKISTAKQLGVEILNWDGFENLIQGTS